VFPGAVAGIRHADEIFTEYAYFSSYSTSWSNTRVACRRDDRASAAHGKQQGDGIASNDGYLLQHFVARGVPVLGIEPAVNVAKVAIERGVPSTVCFFGRKTAHEIAREHGRRTPARQQRARACSDINDFVGGMKILLGRTA